MGTDRTRSLVVPAWLSDPGLLCLTRGYSRISIAHRLPLLVPRDHLAAAQKPVRAHPWLSQLDLVSTELTNRTSIFQTNTENKRKCVEAGTGTHLNVGPGFGGVQDLQRNAISLQLCPELLVAVQAVRARATRGVLLTLQVSCEHQHHPQPPAVISIAVGQYDDNDMRILSMMIPAMTATSTTNSKTAEGKETPRAGQRWRMLGHRPPSRSLRCGR